MNIVMEYAAKGWYKSCLSIIADFYLINNNNNNNNNNNKNYRIYCNVILYYKTQ